MNPEQPIPPADDSDKFPAPSTSPAKVNLLIFFIAMFAPTILTIIFVQAGQKDFPPGIAVIGGIVSGMICGIMLGKRFGRTTGTQVGLAVAFVVVLGIACVVMNCFGCLATGYKMNFH